jgi:shikimate kinase
MNLLLIGYRGTGKSTVARLVAERLGWQWRDADEEVERRAGKSIAAIFEQDGEVVFRDLESGVLADLVQHDQQVLALGGGVILRPENRSLIKKTGKVIWLTADAETILARIRGDVLTAERRPKLTARGGMDEVRELLTAREPFYRECADLVIDTSAQSPKGVATSIVAQVGGLSE